MAKRQKKSGGTKKYGRMLKRAGHTRYNNENRRFWNKLRRVRKYNGEVAAEEYMETYDPRLR